MASGRVRLFTARGAPQDWISGDPSRRIRRRPRALDCTRALDRAEIEALLTRPSLPLRERILWWMLYETAARAQEILNLDADELDLRNRRTIVRRKGGAADVIVWRTATARLLPRLLEGRRTGPVFRPTGPPVFRSPRPTSTWPPVAPGCPTDATECFTTASATLLGGPWTLHQLQHSALTHAAEDGAKTATLLAYSGHTSVASLARYARVSPEALARGSRPATSPPAAPDSHRSGAALARPAHLPRSRSQLGECYESFRYLHNGL